MGSRFNPQKRIASYCSIGIILFSIFLVAVFIGAIYGIETIIKGKFYLDQYATTIFATTAGIVGTMFGLTAASYAFIWGDIRSDSQENCHLGKVLKSYRQRLWHLFVFSLIVTVLVIFTSLLGLALAQKIMSPNLFSATIENTKIIAVYDNVKFKQVSIVSLVNLIFSLVAVVDMAWMNWDIFRRDIQYAIIAESNLNQIQKKYNMSLDQQKDNYMGSIEYEKIHNLEILVERILRNHESIGSAFAESNRREKLLTTVIINELTSDYNVGKEDDKHDCSFQKKMQWDYLREEKKISRWKQCCIKANQEYDLIKKDKKIDVGKKHMQSSKPCDCSFIEVYEDLLTCRDNSLVWEEKCKRNLENEKELLDLFKYRALRYTIKKRLLIFYLQGEKFSDMDLTGVSFSGADLRFTNFSGCNLTGVRLMGTNCQGADFTRSKMAGMYFNDVSSNGGNHTVEIKLSCIDDTESIWNPYNGREATCLKDATFKEADVSRAYLDAPGELEEKQEFPFDFVESNQWKLNKEKVVFPLTGTNFDYAKMFFSYFKNIDLTNSSLEKAQMYNIGMIQVKAKSANFLGAILTNSCLAWCDFKNADFTDASLAETILLRVNFYDAKLENVNFSYSNIVACSFEGASCQNVSFKNMIQNYKDLVDKTPKALIGINLGERRGLNFSYATLTGADFSGANLDDAKFVNSVGQNCIFTKTYGNGINFQNAIFNNSIFNTTKFLESRWKRATLRDSVFTDAQFINSFFLETDFSNSLFTPIDKPCFMGGCMYAVNFSNTRGLTAALFFNICLCKIDFRGTGICKNDFTNGVNLKNCIFEDKIENEK